MSVTPPLLSERDEPYGAGGLYDCSYASYIMAAYKSGYRSFPLGYSYKEREALERADDRPNETGANADDLDLASSRRYGFKLPRVSTTMNTALRGPSTTGLVVPGLYPRLPSWLRRHDPEFRGFHRMYLQPIGDRVRVRVKDPLAPWGFAGDIVPVDDVIAYANSVSAHESHIAKEQTHGYVLSIVRKPISPWRVKAGTMLYGYDPNRPGGPVLTQKFSADSGASYDAEVGVSWPGQSPEPVPHGSPFLRVTSGLFKGLLIVKSRVEV